MSYPALNNVATTDGFTNATTLLCPGAARINVDVYNASVFLEFGEGSPPTWLGEVHLGPTFRSLDRRADAVRVRSFTPGTPARVTIEAIPGGALDG
jgi:hypothetical protein